MTGTEAKSSKGISGEGNGATSARPNSLPGCVGAPILGCAGLPSAKRRIAKAVNGLISAPSGGTLIGWEPNGESRIICSFGSTVWWLK